MTIRSVLTCATLLLAASPVLARQLRENVQPVPKFTGSLVLAGGGKMLPCVPKVFLHLAGAGGAPIVIVHSQGEEPSLKPWTSVDAGGVVRLELASPEDLRADAALVALSGAKGIWLDDPLQALHGDLLMRALLKSAMERGAVIGGRGAAAEALAGAWISDEGDVQRGGFGLLSGALVDVEYRGAKEQKFLKALGAEAGYVGWGIPPAAALVVHHGRQVGAMGKGELAALVGPQENWTARVDGLSSIDAFDPGDVAPYAADLLSWRRSAEIRRDPKPFPPKVAELPSVPKGTLVLHGGGGVNDETWERFIREAGGKKANFVCIPSASSYGAGEAVTSYSAGQLRDRGCRNVTILHTDDPRIADTDPTLTGALAEAKGVWIDGGRTYRVQDSYQYTKIHELLFDVLQRDGVVGGSSAGCQVLGEFLVRGNPRSNKDIVFEGYETGLGLLKGVVLDAHFLDRDRQMPFEGLMESIPQFLGIGVDVNTALIVKRSIGEVFGENPVVFYDYSSGTPRGKEGEMGVILEPGKKYDLAKRKPK